MSGAGWGSVLAWIALGAGCGGGAQVSPDLAIAPFSASACGTCVAAGCAQEVQSCSNDPGCAAAWSCVLGCPTGASGDVDAACAAACPTPSSPSGIAGAQAIDDCRSRGVGGQCAACGRLPPDDGGTNIPLLHQQCTTPAPEPACAMCEDQYCCDSYQTCIGDPDCVTLESCIKACQQQVGCEYTCDQTVPEKAVAEWWSRWACLSELCASPCISSDGCYACQVTLCVDSFVACYSSAECSLIIDCTAPCQKGDTKCVDACVQKYPAGAAAFDAFVLCTGNRCEAACPS